MAKIHNNILQIALIFLLLVLLQPIQVLSHNKSQSQSQSSPPSCNKPHKKHHRNDLQHKHKGGHHKSQAAPKPLSTPENNHDEQHKNDNSNTDTNTNTNGGGGGGVTKNLDVVVNKNVNVSMLDSEFMKWINLIGVLRHSHFPSALNQYKVINTIVVDKLASSGAFPTIQAAIDSIPMVNHGRVVIQVKAGIYKEKVTITPLRSYITLQGAGASKTVIEWDTSGEAGGLGTSEPATVSVNAPYFIARNITFKNSNTKADEGMGGVALRVSADTAAFVGCKFSGTGNTLYDHIGRHFYKECTIEGGLDFIFGQALSVFEGCALSATAKVLKELAFHSAKGLLDNSGMSFLNCRLTGAAVFYLGKAWGTFSRVVIVNSFFDHIQLPHGFENSLKGQNRHLNVFLGMHNCHGPGVEFAKKLFLCKELDISLARTFMSLNLIDGHEWIYQIDQTTTVDMY